jgi:hypothetical protein
MGGIDKDLHWPWLGFALEQALGRGLLEPKDVTAHATAEVLVSQLPQEVLIALFARALANEQISPKSVLETAPPALLAEHLEPDVLWRCLKDAADRAGLSEKGKTRTENGRGWLGSILQGAIETELLGPADVMRHLPPAEFVKDTPLPVMAELIKSGLLGGKFDPSLVLQHLTPAVIAENLESSLAWACIAEAALLRFELAGAASKPKKKERDDDNTGKISVGAAKPGNGARANGNGNGAAAAAPATATAAAGGTPSASNVREPRIEAVAPRRGADKPKSADDWSTAEELDVVEESPLPPPPAAKQSR